MSEILTSVGLDVGTTSTQMVVSRLTVENQASAFSVPRLEITGREIRYRSPIYFTPLLDERHVDVEALEKIVAAEYASAGITPQEVDTGAVIITGETARKDNAQAVLAALSHYAGDFVVSAAGPDLESVLAAKGAGAVEYSRRTGKKVLHMDIGGGTSNLAWIDAGEIVATGCLDVGGRLVKLTPEGRVTYVSPALAGLTELEPGSHATREQIQALCALLATALEMAAGLRPKTSLLEKLATAGADLAGLNPPFPPSVLSFSGGVAGCMQESVPWLTYGDMGPELAQAMERSALCQGEVLLRPEAIRATVIGAGCHSTQLSGSTIYRSNVSLPLFNVPAVLLSDAEQALPEGELAQRIRIRLGDADAVVAMPGLPSPGYDQVRRLARGIAAGFGKRQVLVCLEADMAKALGQALAGILPPGQGCLCMDRLHLSPGSCLDVGAPVGPALPVVVKTLVFSERERRSQ